MKGWRAGCIADHAMIGDGETAGLVHRDGTIDWVSMPRFDSEVCFAALLGMEENGGWWLHPRQGEVLRSWRYLDGTLILETLVETADGSVAVTDFMPIHRGEAPDIVRIVEGRSGTVAMVSRLALRFDHGRTHPLIKSTSAREAIAMAGPNAVALRFDCELRQGERCFESDFSVAAGERVTMTMTWFPSHEKVPKRVDPETALRESCDYWRAWAQRIDHDGADRGALVRSLAPIKALIHRPTGGMIAAATSSLPEWPGGGRNWDYRFCWLRDATFTLQAFLQVGLREEAEAWIAWMRRAIAGDPIDVQPAYSVDGGRLGVEWEANWLEGFAGSRPVRFGNGALEQRQLDVYGEVLDALTLAKASGLAGAAEGPLIAMLADKVAQLWREPDAGIWESRGKLRHHVYSKAMCWVAFDRAASMGEERYRPLAQEVREEVLRQGFNAARSSFTRAYDDDALDAAVLRLPLVGFIDARDERMLGTVAAIERELMVDGLVRRYATVRTDDGVGEDEGAFLAASCWLADVWAMQGREADARALIDRVAGTANDLGLLSEEVSLDTGEMLGNIPQALSHVSYVNSLMRLSRCDRAAGGGDSRRSAAGREPAAARRSPRRRGGRGVSRS